MTTDIKVLEEACGHITKYKPKLGNRIGIMYEAAKSYLALLKGGHETDVIAPREPTDDMEVSGMEASVLGRASVDDPSYVNSIYKAMITASQEKKTNETKI